MARFVIADISDAKSVLQELRTIVPNLPSVPVEHPQLSAERGDTRAGDFRRPFVFWIGNDPEQILDAFASDGRDKPELCKMLVP